MQSAPIQLHHRDTMGAERDRIDEGLNRSPMEGSNLGLDLAGFLCVHCVSVVHSSFSTAWLRLSAASKLLGQSPDPVAGIFAFHFPLSAFACSDHVGKSPFRAAEVPDPKGAQQRSHHQR